MSKTSACLRVLALLAVTVGSLTLSGCAPLLLAGGAVGGYAVAKNLDSPPPPAPSK